MFVCCHIPHACQAAKHIQRLAAHAVFTAAMPASLVRIPAKLSSIAFTQRNAVHIIGSCAQQERTVLPSARSLTQQQQQQQQ
jgi:hypothetical protein